jgi:hypothetical protein
MIASQTKTIKQEPHHSAMVRVRIPRTLRTTGIAGPTGFTRIVGSNGIAGTEFRPTGKYQSVDLPV